MFQKNLSLSLPISLAAPIQILVFVGLSFLSFIWLANLILILAFKKLLQRLNYLFSIFLAATAKFLLLFIIANIYFEFSIVPKIFMQLMGMNQFLTALAGGIISWIIFNFYAKYNTREKRTI